MTPQETRAHRKKKDAQLANIIAAVGAILFGLCVGVCLLFVLALLRDASNNAPIAHSKDLLTPLIACFAVLLAVLAFLRDWNKIQIDRMESNAKILYEQAKEGLEGAFTLLEETTQDRSSWISAARLIVQSQKLGQAIDPYSYYTTAYEIAENNVRVKLQQALTVNGSPLPAAFFFGYENWSDPNLDLTLVHTATKPTNQIHTVGAHTNSVIASPTIQQLDERSVVVVMNFICQTTMSSDPLDEIDVQSHNDWLEYSGVAQGARKYIKLQK